MDVRKRAAAAYRRTVLGLPPEEAPTEESPGAVRPKGASPGDSRSAPGAGRSSQPAPAGPAAVNPAAPKPARFPRFAEAIPPGPSNPGPANSGLPGLAAGPAGSGAPASSAGLRKVAKFLILLGSDEAAKVVRHLSPAEIEEIGSEIAGIKSIDPAEAQKLFEEFGYITKKLAASTLGGPDTAARILEQAFGPDKAQQYLKRQAQAQKPFLYLNGAEPALAAALLKDESVAVISLVLSHLDGPTAAGTLKLLPKDQQLDLVKRLAKMQKISLEILDQVNQRLRKKYEAFAAEPQEQVDGTSRLAEILKHLDYGQEERLLEDLEEQDEALAETLRQQLFDVQALQRVFDEDLELVLRDQTDGDIAILLKGLDASGQEKICRNISSRRLALVKDEQALLGPVRRSEAQAAVKALLGLLREGVKTGKVRMTDGPEEYIT